MSAAGRKKPIRTGDVKALLRKRYCAPEWAIMFEVADVTGANQRRYADAVAMSLWPSRGLKLHGFEIKVSRSDWLRELRSPEKSVPVQSYCDYWWLVAPDGVLKPGELPATWGYIRATAKTLTPEKEAPALEDAKSVDRGFVASMLRRASGADEAEIAALVEDQVRPLRDRIDDEIRHRVDARLRHAEQGTELIREIGEACGIDLERRRFTGENITDFFSNADFANAVALVHRTGVARSYRGLKALAEQSREFADRIEKGFEEVQGKTNQEAQAKDA